MFADDSVGNPQAEAGTRVVFGRDEGVEDFMPQLVWAALPGVGYDDANAGSLRRIPFKQERPSMFFRKTALGMPSTMAQDSFTALNLMDLVKLVLAPL